MREHVEIDQKFESMLISAERYACGRRTYIVSTTVDYLLTLLPKLSDWCLGVLQQDLCGRRSMAEQIGNDRIWGDACDQCEWKRLMTALEAETERRNSHE